MIARLWHGEVPSSKANDYHDFLKLSGLKDYAGTTGNQGVFLLKKEESRITHFYTFTLWENLDAIKSFAGEDYTKARYYPEDRDFLLSFEESVQHFDVLEKPATL